MSRRPGFLALTIALAAAVGSVSTASAADREHPTVVELFQSQGCSSCPPANANLMAFADRPDILALSFGVTYWDSLGWKDTFAQPQFTARQSAYAQARGSDQVFTPQVVVNGRADGVGADRHEFEALIRAGDRGDGGPRLTLEPGAVSISAATAPQAGADVFLVRYDPRVVQVPIQRGENGGKTLPHRNVVRQLVRLGRWTGAAARFTLPAGQDPNLSTAILVQTAGAGPILAAARS